VRFDAKKGEVRDMIKRRLLISSLVVVVSAGFASADSYMLTDNWGGSWCDAEKSPAPNNQDDLMCWAAAASNVLEWTGWGKVESMTNTDQMFTYFQDHWTDKGGMMDFGWDWWFDGTNDSEGWDGWSQVDVAGGGFFPSETFSDYYVENWNTSQSMSAIDEYLHDGYGVTLAVYGDISGGHAITCWGYDYSTTPNEYLGLWVTDSDDDKGDSTPEDELKYYDVEYDSDAGKWYLADFYGRDDWYIGGVEALKTPEPATGSLLIVSMALLLTRRRKTASGKSGK
jgi:hypothetical protein